MSLVVLAVFAGSGTEGLAAQRYPSPEPPSTSIAVRTTATPRSPRYSSPTLPSVPVRPVNPSGAGDEPPGPDVADGATPAVRAARVYTVASARVGRVEIHSSPVQRTSARTLENPQPSGAAPGSTYPLKMLVIEEQGDWLRVLLPTGPNGSSGWIRRNVVDLEIHDYRILVELGEHRVTVWKGDEVMLQEAVAVGASGRSLTTQGLFFTTELFEVVPSQQSAYGPFAYALSGFSELLHTFGDGSAGVLGLHGTSDTSSLGRDVSNGCIRMSNTAITKLANMLPLGVPVEIRA